MVFNPLSGCYEAALDTRAFADGEVNLNVTATDLAGHVSSSSTPFKIDNTACAPVVTYPRDGNVVWGEVQVTAEVSDVHLDRTEYCVDGNGWNDLGAALDTTGR